VRNIASVGRADSLLDYKHLSNLNEAREAGRNILGLLKIVFTKVDTKYSKKAPVIDG
jgi:hypothetical protein